MKIKLHIPTEQYGFVEIEAEANPEADKPLEEVVEDAIRFYKRSNAQKRGLPHKEWNRVLENFVEREPMFPENYEEMDDYQVFTIQELKKLFKRLKARELRNNE